MTMFNDERLAWRDVPLDVALPPSAVRQRLISAGYTTLGKVLADSAAEIAARAAYVGPVRARNARAAALIAAKHINSVDLVIKRNDSESVTPQAAAPFKPWRSEILGAAIGVIGGTFVVLVATLTLPILRGM
jgi:hypothetical protein